MVTIGDTIPRCGHVVHLYLATWGGFPGLEAFRCRLLTSTNSLRRNRLA